MLYSEIVVIDHRNLAIRIQPSAFTPACNIELFNDDTSVRWKACHRLSVVIFDNIAISNMVY